MKVTALLTILAVTFLVFNTADAQFVSPTWGYGFEAGGARGDNAGNDEEWVPQMRGHLQLKITPQLLTQFGMGYTELSGGDRYSTQTLMGDVRLLFSPFQMNELYPYFYAGFGATKDMGSGGTDYLPLIPAGIGIQTKLGPQLLLQIGGGYNLSLSDELDGRVRSNEELNTFTNMEHDGFFNIMVGLVYTSPVEGADDPDHDGLSNPLEKEYKTDPKNPDTDSDGLNDGDEVKQYRTDPLKNDTDADGLTDADEVNINRCDPLKADTDGDGFNDGIEVTQYKTDPSKADTDGDELSDSDEIQKHHSDPIKADTDGDGLGDGDELLKYQSDLLKTDTDNDSLADGDEVSKYKTDPSKADTDGDGLNDFAEVTTHHTDPLKVDSDGGGMVDGAEIKANKNPLDPKDDLFDLSKGAKVVLRGINFEFNKARILPESEPVLEKARESLVANPDVTVIISGHTDNVGNDDYNRNLSLKRAQAVKDWLVAKGISGNRMKVVGKGKSEPVVSNDTDEGRAENRRIEFTVE